MVLGANMRIFFSPARSDRSLELTVNGDILVINGEPFDFSPLGEGEELPARAAGSMWVVGPPVRRVGGEITVTVMLPHGADASEAALYPGSIDQSSGVVELPS
jgi:hypothetical protein